MNILIVNLLELASANAIFGFVTSSKIRSKLLSVEVEANFSSQDQCFLVKFSSVVDGLKDKMKFYPELKDLVQALEKKLGIMGNYLLKVTLSNSSEV